MPTKPNKWQILHRLVSVAIAFAVPATIYLKNGVLEPWMFVLGAVLAFFYWYFFPFVFPFL